MSDHEKMPEPMKMWLARDDDTHPWEYADEEDDAKWYKEYIGPHKIVPGMMGMDELAERKLFLSSYHMGDGKLFWIVENDNSDTLVDELNTALEAQWAATCLAREKEKTDAKV